VCAIFGAPNVTAHDVTERPETPRMRQHIICGRETAIARVKKSPFRSFGELARARRLFSGKRRRRSLKSFWATRAAAVTS